MERDVLGVQEDMRVALQRGDLQFNIAESGKWRVSEGLLYVWVRPLSSHGMPPDDLPGG